MTRASITVVLKNGIHYDTTLVMPTLEDHTTRRPMLTFMCSGRMQSVPAEDVESLTFNASGTPWWGLCDQPLPQG